MSDHQASHIEAFLLVEVPATKAGNLLDRLIGENSQYVVEAHAVWGEADIIARVSVPDSPKLAYLVMEVLQEIEVVETTRTFLTIEGMTHKTSLSDSSMKGDVNAFIFLSVDPGKSDEVAKLLVSEHPDCVLDAHAVWGSADVIVRVSVASLDALQMFIFEHVQSRRHVSVTRTHLLIPGMSRYNRDLKTVF